MRTKVISSTVPVWLTEFWIPVYLPTLGELLTVKLYDKQDLGGNVLVASLQLRTDHIFRGDAEGLRWYHLAHGDERAESRARTADRHDTRTEPHPHPGLPHPSDYVCGQTPYNTFMFAHEFPWIADCPSPYDDECLLAYFIPESLR